MATRLNFADWLLADATEDADRALAAADLNPAQQHLVAAIRVVFVALAFGAALGVTLLAAVGLIAAIDRGWHGPWPWLAFALPCVLIFVLRRLRVLLKSRLLRAVARRAARNGAVALSSASVSASPVAIPVDARPAAPAETAARTHVL